MQSAVSSFSSPAIGGAGFKRYLWRSGKRDENRRDSSARWRGPRASGDGASRGPLEGQQRQGCGLAGPEMWLILLHT